MRIQYFPDTDTLHIELRKCNICETRDLDENTLLDLAEDGSLCAITIEHASTRTDLQGLTIDGIAV